MAAKVKTAVERAGLRNCEVRLALSDREPDGAGVNLSDPETYASRRSKDTFKGYVYQIGTFPDDSIDLVIVDGRARPVALRHATREVKPGGFLLLVMQTGLLTNLAFTMSQVGKIRAFRSQV
jgi:hypothetical protein